MLDKIANTGYNPYIGYSEVKPLEDTTTSEPMSTDVLEDLTEACGILNKLSSTYDVKPIVAGGSIRDAILGYAPKDFDIFIDVSSIPDEEERDDFIESFVYDFAVAKNGIKFAETSGWPYKMQRDESAEREGYGEMEGSFSVREWACGTNKTWAPYQFIFMDDVEITVDPSDWISKRFDYSLVKCFMDPHTGTIYASDEFMSDKDKNRIDVRDESAYKRLTRWILRTEAPYTPVLYKDRNEKDKAKSPAMPKVQLQRWLQHPTKWVG